jgi:phage-related minor tail protein
LAGEVGALRITIGLNAAGVTQGIKSLNQSLNALNSEYKALSTGSAKYDQSLETLRARQDVLNRSMQTHQQKVEELRRKYEESKASKGEDAAETLRLAQAYNNAVAAMRTTEQRLNSLNAQIESQTNAFSILEREVNSNVDSITRQMRVLESGYAAAAAGADHLGDSVEGMQQRQEHLNQSLTLQVVRSLCP